MVLFTYIIGNFIPLIQTLVLIGLWFLPATIACQILLSLLWLYIAPPLLVRIIFIIWGKPVGEFHVNSKQFRVWYFSAQLQALYLRFNFLEEVLRLIPTVYSFWLRCWGSKIGPLVYWAPKTTLMDRSYLNIGRQVLIGYGAGMTAHHINRVGESVSIVIAPIEIGDHAILGGLSGMTSGSSVAAYELLPSTMGLAPFYQWKNGRRHSTKEKTT